MSKTDLTPVDALIEAAIADGAFPGACYAVGRNGEVRIKSLGRYMYCPDSQPVADDTLWDLASVSKVVGCTTAAMLLADDGKLNLDEPVAKHIPEFAQNGKESVTPRNLLLHNAGFPGWIPYHKTPELSADQCIAQLYAAKPTYPIGTKTIYSDCSMIALGKLIERLAGQGMDQLLKDRVFAPLGMTRTMYNPNKQDHAADCAPTESLEDWRIKAREHRKELPPKRGAQCHPDEHLYVQGEVHDPSAYMIGGVSGNAGLFSTAADLARFSQMMLDQGIFWGRRLLKPETVQHWTTRLSPESSRALGWDTRSEKSSAGTKFSPQSFGHTGYTGTSLWIDPTNHMFAALLTNRVHPTAENSKLIRFRPEFHTAVATAFGL
jgi:CubicO group peptidase (beta-lactamase class C family)